MWLGLSNPTVRSTPVPGMNHDPFLAKKRDRRIAAYADAAHSEHLSNNCPHITGYKETRKLTHTHSAMYLVAGKVPSWKLK